MKLTSGFEDFGFGQTEDECIDDAIKNSYITREEIELGLARHEQLNVIGNGLYFSEDDKEYNEAKREYEESFAKAQEAFDKEMAGAPAMKFMAKQSPERQEFLDRAEAAFAAIEGPARIKFDAEFPE